MRNFIEVVFQDENYKKFDTLEDAEFYRGSLHSDDCMNNLRFSYLPFSTEIYFSDDEFDEMTQTYQDYLDQRADGCCGFMDEKIFIGHKMAIIGCNFGH